MRYYLLATPLRGAFCAVVVAMLVPACSKSISGTYSASDEAAAWMLQVVERRNREISGTLQTAVLKGNGAVETSTASISGVIDGESLALAIKPNQLLAPPNAVTGVAAAGAITLTFANGDAISQLKLQRAPVSTFVKASLALQQRGEAVIVAATREADQEKMREAAAARSKLVAELAAEFGRTAKADVDALQKISSFLKQYRLKTIRVANWWSQALAIKGESDASSAARDALHSRIRASHMDLSGDEGVLRDTIQRFEEHSRDLWQGFDAQQSYCEQNAKEECKRLYLAVNHYRIESERLRSALKSANSVIDIEDGKRRQILAKLN